MPLRNQNKYILRRQAVMRFPLFILLGLFFLNSCSHVERLVKPHRYIEKRAGVSQPPHETYGKASWYGPGFQGRRTSSGEIFDQNKMTAGSKTLPLGTVVEVTNLQNNKKVDVKINDRGPWIKGRKIDLSSGAARELGMLKTGVAPVKIKIKSKPSRRNKHHHHHHRHT